MKKILGLTVVLVGVVAVRQWARDSPELSPSDETEKTAAPKVKTKMNFAPVQAGFDGLPKPRPPEPTATATPPASPQIYPDAQEDLSFLDSSPYPDPYYRGDNGYGRPVPYPGPDEVVRDFDGEEIEVYRN